MNPLEHPFEATTLVDLLRYRAIYQPNVLAYTFLADGETEEVDLTYEELDRKARAIAVCLQSICPPEERALLIYPPGIDYIVAFFGCLYAGVIAVPAYPPRPNRSATRLQTMIADARPKVGLTVRSVLAGLERQGDRAPELKSLRWLATDNLNDKLAIDWQHPSLSGDTLAFLQYTSGSTAEPKGVAIAHQNLLHNLSWIYRRFEHTPNSKGVIWLPLYHDMGLIGGVLQPLYGGFPTILMSPLMFLQSPIRWLQAISRYRATTSGGPNFAYNLVSRKVTPDQLANLDLSSWGVAFNGAETISYEIIEQFSTLLEPCGFRREAFYPCYGMAEATLFISGGQKTAPIAYKKLKAKAIEKHRVIPASDGEANFRIVVGCGQSLPDQKAIVVNPETMTRCAHNEVGEIWVSGASIARGYWNRPEETERTFYAYLADTGEGPFLRTGDLGFIEDGELFITGRLKDTIVINGRNYYPQDIEWTVEQSHSLIRPNCSASFSVEMEGEERLVILAEVERSYRKRHLEADYSPESPTDASKALIQAIRKAVLQQYDLQVYDVLLLKPGALPKTSSGKIQRHLCRTHYLAGTLEVL
ncbi:acyl-CoA synthetase (AMP-forming)/AMP-acid ligase II [Pleurocapsa sp. PCC 7327]|uniref:fatty acyl-AMP ligase n=1 Tax=Pleurocapsa sp. PCC 7327 TaxID=118163 RepID=UPI00029FE5C8|nr:fatty acyl-AMP ligase [Pleurocapsa sp. PCC 7327]AFY79258.1 acyl-CoA synthetase (AMP-forming)/AMP-acid ligase II [Pleurocapsa sp. PCC 7327]